MGSRFAVNQIELEFGDGTHVFRLGLAQIAELQEKCGAGIGSIYKRLLQADYRAEDCVEAIRLGLIGGGMKAVEARRLVDHYCGLETFVLRDAWQHAVAIVGACTIGYEPPEDSKKKPKAKPETSTK